MPPATTKRKRNRKRKRRNDVSSSSSSDSDSESAASSSALKSPQKLASRNAPTPSKAEVDSDDTDSSSDSSDASSSSSDDDVQRKFKNKTGDINDVVMDDADKPETNATRRDSRSPSPVPPKRILPSFLPEDVEKEDEQAAQQQLKEKFRKFWMERMAAGFKGDLEHIRKVYPSSNHCVIY